MASPNIVMRDPTIYRIRHASHHRTGDKWCIYPMYDFTHCLSDSLEGITHSICTLEFDNNRELYDWVLDTLDVYRSQQIEFARLNLTYTVLSKRKLIQLVKEGYVRGWDDPRMPTICGLRRRGYTPESIRDFCSRIGIARAADSKVHYSLLEFCCREHLNAVTPRCMAVLDPIKVVITDYPEDKVEEFEQPLHPEDESFGSRKVPFCREIWIDRDDFREDPPKKYFRLAPGVEVRLLYAYYITCQEVIKDEAGNIIYNTLNIGNFISAVINFLILALVVFWLVKGLNKLAAIGKKKEEEAAAPEAPAEPEPPAPSAEEVLLTEIRDLLKNK
jgi:glutaminyl-tRNA synthetase